MGHIGRESVDTKGLVSLTSDVSNEIWKIGGVIQRSEEETFRAGRAARPWA